MPALLPSTRPRLTVPTLPSLLLGLACAAAVPAQAQTSASATTSASASSASAALSDRAWTDCLQRLQPVAQHNGVRPDTWSRLLAGVQPDPSVLDKLDNQPEFKTPIWDYMAALVDDERVADGRQRLTEHADTLQRVEQTYGVPAATVVAVWGVESNFGQGFGRYPLVQALGTLSCAGRRQAFFQKELFATLRIAQAGDVAPEALVGSWAGAFGHTQFMPTTYERLAVDFDGDGHRDLTASVPDALASTAHFLKQAGWTPGLAWGVEVVWPQANAANLQGEGRKTKRSAATWAERGLRTADGRALSAVFPPDTPLGLMAPKGPQGEVGPLFLVSRNFDAIYSYNAAESYGLAIAHLADRMRGGAAFQTPWPTDDLGLSRAQRRELQALLQLKGHDIGTIDGMLGDKSRAAIRAEQTRLGHAVTGRAGQRLLQALNAR